MFKAKDIMRTDVLSVTKDSPIRKAIDMLVENGIAGLPVVDVDMKVIGTISEERILELLYNHSANEGYVEDYMTCGVVSFDVEDDLVEVCESLIENSCRHVPVLSNGKLAGIISRRNIISHIQKNRCREKIVI
jgi:CBS domain-containing protein